MMLEEIAQQPEALARTIEGEREKVARLGQYLRSRDVDLIVLVARGSSDNAALFGRYLLEITTGIPVALAAPSVNTVYGARLRLERALVVGVSQSGEGEDINRVLEMARAEGACCTVGITNEPDSSMTKIVQETLLTHGGRERSVAATKTYTGQLLHFYMLAEALSDGKKLDFEAIPDFAARALALRAEVERVVERYVFMENCVVVGRGLVYANAFEMALKLMETCYVVAERFSSADFLHGPLAVVERHFPIFAFAPPGVTLHGVRELLARLKELRADTLVFTSDSEAAALSTRALMLPTEIDEMLAVIPYIIPAQLFAALLADAKGLDPDAPRSLAKVTRTL
ncbi:MAG TPA: SIS domain-containing protein [Pyrinomonadaceae bacterium]|jgi:glucosamine--fructose-6-phosphate aminotransferase (isomerizing)|nr:SIS domain-containing protein [Pyrinomonadaceae bacterium]